MTISTAERIALNNLARYIEAHDHSPIAAARLDNHLVASFNGEGISLRDLRALRELARRVEQETA